MHSQREGQPKHRHFEWSNSDAPHWRADTTRARARRCATRARRVERRERARPNTAAGEAGQVCVNPHESMDQQGSQASERARPPVLKAVSRKSIANSSPKCMPGIMVRRVVVGKRVILLGDSEDV